MASKKTSENETPVLPEDAMNQAIAEIEAEKAAVVEGGAGDEATDSADEQALDEEIAKAQEALNQLIMQKTAFYNRGYHRSTDKQYRESMSSEHIRTEFADSTVKNEQTELKEDWTLLTASKANGAILEGIVLGLHNPGNGENTTPCAKIGFKNNTYKVYIPFYVLLPHVEMRKFLENDSRMEIEKMIIRMVGSRIKFVVRDIDQKTHTCFADRLQAMHTDFYTNWVRPAKGDNKPLITPGMLIQAQIIGKSRQTLTLSAFGIDQTLVIKSKEAANEISWEYEPDLRTKFKVGEFVNVKVLSVGQSEKTVGPNTYTIGKAEFSIRQATRNPMDKYWDDYHEGDIVQAEVTGMNATSYFVKLENKVQAMCGKPRDGIRQPEIGDKGCLVRITEKAMDEDGSRKRIYGVFTSF